MALIKRIRMSLTGFPGGPGVITWYGLDAVSLAGPMQNWFNDIRDLFPPNVTAHVATSGDSIEDTTGVLAGSWSGGATATIVGTGVGAYAGPVGASVNWLTDTIVDGHRLRGRTFAVPLAGAAFDTDGTLSATALASIRLASVNAVTAAANNFCIWHRPFAGSAATATKPARPAHLGSHSLVTASSVPDKAAVLRSRRD